MSKQTKRMRPGDEVTVFDPKLWGSRDQGDNSQFFKTATVLSVYYKRPNPYSSGGWLADVRFHHDGRVSHGHFVDCIERDSTRMLKESCNAV